jgi:hypothetical protein
VTTVLEDGPTTADPDEPDHHRRLVRVVSGVLAVALLVVAALLLTRHHAPARTPRAFCADLSATRGITTVLASGDAAQISAAVRQLDRAARAAPLTISPQVEVLVRYADGLAAAVQRGSNDPDAALEAAVRRQATQAAKVEQAGRALEGYVRATCGFAL